jgi:hypothetical protein
MALAHQARAARVRPQTVAVLGGSGVGKTVYLGMLMDMLSRQTGSLQALARGAFSISLQQATTSAMAGGWFPEKTPNEPDRWNWVHCQISSKNARQPLEMIVPDMAGEAIVQEIDHPNTFPVIRSLIRKCSGVIILVDAIRLQAGDHGQDFATMKILSFLRETEAARTRRHRKRATLPLAIVFTKADQCDDCFEDTDSFAHMHAAGMIRHLEQTFANYRLFASGVAGACAFRESRADGRRRIPLRIEPRGIVEPLQWMLSQLSSHGHSNGKARS